VVESHKISKFISEFFSFYFLQNHTFND